jgi:hypothetical protein
MASTPLVKASVLDVGTERLHGGVVKRVFEAVQRVIHTAFERGCVLGRRDTGPSKSPLERRGRGGAAVEQPGEESADRGQIVRPLRLASERRVRGPKVPAPARERRAERVRPRERVFAGWLLDDHVSAADRRASAFRMEVDEVVGVRQLVKGQRYLLARLP